MNINYANNIVYNGDNSLNTIKRNDVIGLKYLEIPSEFLFMPVDIEDYTDYKNRTYKLRLTGFTETGIKTSIIVDDIEIYFDILCDHYEGDSLFDFKDPINDLEDIFRENNIDIIKIDDIYAYPLFGYNDRKKLFKRVYTNNTTDRKNAIEAVRKKGYITASDDLSCYYRKVSRDYLLKYADWLHIQKHNVKVIGNRFAIGNVSIRNVKNYTGPITGNLKKDKLLVMTWDIETYSDSNTGEVPKPERAGDIIFMICCSFHWGLDFVDTEPLYKVCIVDKELEPADVKHKVHTIVCQNELNIIKAFGLLVHNLMPDVIIGFNDHDYDWNFLLERSKMYGILAWLYNKMSLITKKTLTDSYAYERMVQRRAVKISPSETMFSKYFRCVGLVPIDIRVCFKKIHKKEEITKGSSLNFYLKINKLDQKVDLPHTKMFKIYENDDIKGMDLVRYYCIVDSISCFKLFAKQLVLSTLRENANLSYIGIFDEYINAGSMKIRNKIIADAQKFGILCPNITREKIFSKDDKFAGAHVFDPIKGLESKRPVIPLDFKSLYPNIFIGFNLSPEKFISDPDLAQDLINRGYNLYHIDFDFKNQHYDAWFVRHNCTDFTPELTGESRAKSYGLIPTILRGLFASRVSIQKQQKAMGLEELKDHEITDEMRFEYDRLEIKQKAIKIFMNSIYGVSGMDINPLFLLEQAVATTKTGRMLITTVADYVRKKGFTVKYGDSVAKWTQVMISNSSDHEILAIEDIAKKYGDNKWKRFNDRIDCEKEYCELPIKVWSDKGWTKAHRIIRHKLHHTKKMIRVTTKNYSHVDVTDDHSLLLSNGKMISPKDLKVGDRIMHHPLPKEFKSIEIEKKHDDNVVVSLKEINYSNNDYVYDFTTDNHHFAAGVGNIIVHNTDSVYLTAPDHYYVELDKLYESGQLDKIDYWSKLVELSQQIAYNIRDETNEFLKNVVGNSHIKMEDEEIKFPCMFTGKKKYAGIKHEGKPDFYPKKWFIRGIDIIKEGQPQIAIDIGQRIMKRIFDPLKPDNLEVIQIVEEEFIDAIKNKEQWSINDFVQSDAYRPTKDNKTVKRFVERMKLLHEKEKEENKRITEAGGQPIEYLYEPPSPGERFKYIVTKQTEFFDIKGKKITLKKGDLMHYVHVVEKLNLPIDIAEYLRSKVISVGARFINFYPQFQPKKEINPDDLDDESDTEEDLSAADKYAQKEAKKYLENILKQFTAPKVDHHKYKRAYKEIEKSVKSTLGSKYNLLESLEVLGCTDNISELKEIVKSLAEKIVNETKSELIENHNRLLLNNMGINPKNGSDINSDNKSSKMLFKYYKAVNELVKSDEKIIDQYLDSMNLSKIHDAIKKYNMTFEDLVIRKRRVLCDDAEDDIMIDSIEDSIDYQTIEEFQEQFNIILTSKLERYISNKKLLEKLNSFKVKRIGMYQI
jgi:DNA polymerase elongation subunit (family B)